MDCIEVECLKDYIAVLERQAVELDRSLRRNRGYPPERIRYSDELVRLRYQIRQAERRIAEFYTEREVA